MTNAPSSEQLESLDRLLNPADYPPTQEDLVSANVLIAKANAQLRAENSALKEENARLLQENKSLAVKEEYARKSLSESPAASKLELRAALEGVLEMMPSIPDPHCSCHIAPPCGDCVEYFGIREAIQAANAALAKEEAK